MTIIEGISDQPQQQLTVPLLGGSTFLLTLSYSLQQECWFYSISWNGSVVCNGQRLVTSPNILRQYINTIPFGIACLTDGNVEPTTIEDLSNGLAQMILLQGTDIALVEQTAFGAPPQPLQATATTSNGQQIIIPPSQWGPATGDLSGNYPGPSVVAVHEGGGQQLTISPITDGQFVKRVGSSLVGATIVPGAGNVVGPSGATSGNLAKFADATGLLIGDSGESLTTINAAISAAQAAAETFATGAAATAQTAAEAFATAAAAAAQAASYPGLGKIPPSSASGKVNWNLRFFVEDYATVQLAFTAACTAGGILMLPPGVTANAGSPLTWPANFAGNVKIQGCSSKVSTLAGSIQLVSTGSPIFEIEGIRTGGGIAVDLTGSSYAGNQQSGAIRDVYAAGTISYAADLHAFYLKNFGQGILENLNGFGTGNTSGNALTIDTSSNVQVTNFTCFNYAKGLNALGSVAGYQITNFRAVNCGYGIYSVLGAGQAFQMTNWMVDNGNPVSSTISTPCVYLQGAGSSQPSPYILSNGTVLQTNGASPLYGIELVSTYGVRIRDVDFTFCEASDSAVFISSSSKFSTVGGCMTGGQNLVHVDATSTSNFAIGNTIGATFLNSGGGTNSLVS